MNFNEAKFSLPHLNCMKRHFLSHYIIKIMCFIIIRFYSWATQDCSGSPFRLRGIVVGFLMTALLCTPHSLSRLCSLTIILRSPFFPFISTGSIVSSTTVEIRYLFWSIEILSVAFSCLLHNHNGQQVLRW